MSDEISSRSSRFVLLLLGLLVLLGAAVRGHNLTTVAERSPDERVYRAQAQVLATQGVSGLRALAAQYQADSQRLYPPPSRVGATAPVAGLMVLTGRDDLWWGALWSCVCSVGSLLLVALIGYRFFTPAVAVLATGLYASFPAELVIARRAWTDAGLELLACALLYLCFVLGRRAAGKAALALFVGLSALFVMTKEASVFVLGFCLAWLLWQRGRQALVPVLACAGAVALGVLFNAWLIGGLPVLWDIQSRFAEFNALNAYSQDYQTGPVFRLWQSFFIMSPLVFILALVGMPLAWRSQPARDRAVAIGLAVFAAWMLCLPVLLPSWLNLRFASPVFGPLCLLAAGAVQAGWRWLSPHVSGASRPWWVAFGLGLLLLHAGRDWRFFEQGFVQRDTPDLSAGLVFSAAQWPWSAPRAQQTSAQPDPRAAQALAQSLRLYQEKRYEASMEAARQALALRPGYAEAYNNLAAAHAELGQWDAAIEAAQQALRLAPGWALARNNLAWAQQEKARAAASPRAQ